MEQLQKYIFKFKHHKYLKDQCDDILDQYDDILCDDFIADELEYMLSLSEKYNNNFSLIMHHYGEDI